MGGRVNKARVKFWIDGLRYRLLGPTHTFLGSDQAGMPGFRATAFAGRQEYVSHLRRCKAEYEERRQIMRELGTATAPIANHIPSRTIRTGNSTIPSRFNPCPGNTPSSQQARGPDRDGSSGPDDDPYATGP